MSPSIRKICCIGAGFVGGPTMAVIADKCPQLRVSVVDINSKRVDEWNNQDLNKLPVYEPGLKDVISRCRGKNLFFSKEIEENISDSDMIFISVNTRIKKNGVGAGEASDLKWIESSARQIGNYAKGHTIVVEKSTLPVRTAQKIKEILEAYKSISTEDGSKKKEFSILSNPEFLSEGTAINDLENPDRILIGGDDPKAIEKLVEIYLNWVPRERILKTNLWSSELSKLIANAFLAQRISSINSVSALCESTGADVKEVARAIGMDKRIGNQFINTGPGFGGSCFKKDILNLVYISRHYDLKEVADYWQGVLNINTWQKSRISKIIVEKLFSTITGKKLSILGFSFKANTNDTRESPAINICKDLLEEGCNLSIYEPKVKATQIEKDLGLIQQKEFKIITEGQWQYSKSIISSAEGSDAIVILREWEEFKLINWEQLSKVMRSPSWIFDTRCITNIEEAKQYGFNVWRLGNG